MEAFLYLVLWIALILLMMRFGCASHASGPEHAPTEQHGGAGDRGPRPLRWIAPETDVDPVCAKTVRTADAKSSVYGGTVHYFCSRECRERFEAAPDLYSGIVRSDHPKLKHSHG